MVIDFQILRIKSFTTEGSKARILPMKKTEQKKAHIKILSDSFKSFMVPMLSTRLVYYYYYEYKKTIEKQALTNWRCKIINRIIS